MNGEVEKANGVNGDAPATNGDIKAEDKETASGDAPTEEKEGEVSKENEGNDGKFDLFKIIILMLNSMTIPDDLMIFYFTILPSCRDSRNKGRMQKRIC